MCARASTVMAHTVTRLCIFVLHTCQMEETRSSLPAKLSEAHNNPHTHTHETDHTKANRKKHQMTVFTPEGTSFASLRKSMGAVSRDPNLECRQLTHVWI